MKYKRLICILLVLILQFSVLRPMATEENEENLIVTNGCHSVDGAVSFLGSGKIVDNLQSAFVFETKSETLMYMWNPDVQLYPASLVKIMTALLVLEKGQLTDIVTVKASTINDLPDNAISVNLVEGERISVEDLMYCMIVQSANDAAAVLAEYVSGSQSDFIALMNQRAAELGCTGTNYVNPHGLHHQEQLTTARDTCRILYAALDFLAFREMFCTVWYTVEPTNMHDARYLASNNYLMNTDEVGIHFDGRVIGGRAGTTTDGFRCVASLSQSGNMEMICVVMGSQSSYIADGHKVNSFGGFPETSQLLDRAYSGLSRKQVVFENQILRQQSVMNGDSDVFMAAKEDFSVVLPSNISNEDLTYRYFDVPGSDTAPIVSGQNMASLQVWYGSMCVAETDIYAMNDVPLSTSKVLTQSESDDGMSAVAVLGIILVSAAFLFVATLYGIRYYSRRRHRSQRKKRTGR